MSFSPFLPFLTAFGCSGVVIWVTIKLCHKWQAYDMPAEENAGKIHETPTPSFGGIGIFLGVLLTVLLSSRWFLTNHEFQTPFFLALLGGAFIMGILGLFDDIHFLSARLRFGVQTAVSILMVTLFYQQMGCIGGFVGFLIHVVWMVGITNAVNLMDNIDGVTGGTTAIIAMGLMIVSLRVMDMTVSLLLWAFLGAVFAFLVFNFKPARIFMGDTGTLFIGFMLAALTLRLSHTISFDLMQAPWLSIQHALAIPLFCGVPIFDTTLATSLRLINKRPIYIADGSNLTYRLLHLNMADVEVVLFQYFMQLIFTGTALVMVFGRSNWWLVLGLAVYSSAIGLGVFLYHRSKKPFPNS